jgi:predicted MFS family arabinose efflux permease
LKKVLNYDKRAQLQNRFSPTFVILLTAFVDILGYGMIFPLLPLLNVELGYSSFELGILVASFAFMQFIFGPILGRISDRIGRRPIIIISVLTSMGSFILFTIANSFLLLLFSRIIGGLATEIGVAQAYIVDITDEKTRVKGLARLAAALGLGIIMGPAIGGFLGEIDFWVAGLAATILTFVNLLLVILLMPETYNISQVIDEKKDKIEESYLKRIVKILKNPLVNSILGISFVISLGFSLIFVIIPLFGLDFFGFGPLEIGLVLTYWGIIGVGTQTFLVERLERRFRDELLIAAGCILSIIAFVGMPLTPNFLIFMIFGTILIFGVEIIDTIIPSFLSKRISKNQQGGMLGINNSISSLARIPGPLIGSLLYYYALSYPFFLGAIVLLFALVFSMRIYINRNRNQRKIKEEKITPVIDPESIKPF